MSQRRLARLLVWRSTAGETDSAVHGARKRKGKRFWSKPFVMADRRGFPDCNTCMMVDSQPRLWLFWPTIVANSWETCLMNYRGTATVHAKVPAGPE